MGTPIINQPQVAIMGLGAIKKRPMVIETEQGDFILAKEQCVSDSFHFDHRLIDGALGGQFIVRGRNISKTTESNLICYK